MLTSTSFSDFDGSMSLDGNFFSMPKTTPSLVLTPIAVDPNFNQILSLHDIGTYLNGFDSILNLIDSTFWRKCVDTTIVVLLTI
jgi:hypothetical protein